MITVTIDGGNGARAASSSNDAPHSARFGSDDGHSKVIVSDNDEYSPDDSIPNLSPGNIITERKTADYIQADGDSDRIVVAVEAQNQKHERGLRFWSIIIGLSVTGLLSALENTVVTTSLPAIVTALNIGQRPRTMSGSSIYFS